MSTTAVDASPEPTPAAPEADEVLNFVRREITAAAAHLSFT